ncbi:DPH3-like [Tropilaelaps mercedesae]|uniref:Diphthamide biosynthesis protein 3 n=1 Tax=Tropilaelaps mercedesae TaxID=418985 RepID=A0A1V9X1P3_9ACAR|nr:DPH3-like [Tropilaelaps mercedesae]
MSVYHDEVEIEDFEFDEETESYYYPCPCGDRFVITKLDLQVFAEKRFEDDTAGLLILVRAAVASVGASA